MGGMLMPAALLFATIAQSPAVIAVIPQPAKVTERQGRFTITARTVVWADTASEPIAQQFARYLEPATGFTLRVRTGGAPPAGSIAFRRDRTLTRLGAEGYTLDVRPSR